MASIENMIGHGNTLVILFNNETH